MYFHISSLLESFVLILFCKYESAQTKLKDAQKKGGKKQETAGCITYFAVLPYHINIYL